MNNADIARDTDMNSPHNFNNVEISGSLRAHLYTEWLIKYRRILTGLIILAVIITGFGASMLGLTTDNRVFFGPDNPQLLDFEKFEKTYTESNNVIVAFSPRDGNVFNNQTLAAIEEFTKAAWKIPFSSRVDSLSNFQHTYAKDDELIIGDLVTGAENLSDKQISTIKSIALSEPLIKNRLISKDSSVAAANINFILPDRNDDKSIQAVVSALNLLKQQLEENHPGLKLYLSGDIVLGAAVGEATEDDVSTLIPAMFILILIIIGIIQRSMSATAATLSLVIATIVTTMGLAGWLGYILNPGSAIAPTIIITICATYCVHIINSFFSNTNNTNKTDKIASAISHNIHAVFLTCLTTIIGFLSMLFSDSPPFHDLGILVSMGIAITFIYVFTLLPVLLYMLPLKQSSANRVSFSKIPVINWIINLAERKNITVLASILVVLFAAIYGATQIQLIDDWVEYFDERYTFRTDSDFIIENLTGIESLEFSLDSGMANGASKSAFLITIDNFSNWLREQPGVDYVYTLSDIIKRINKNMHNDDPAYYKIPENDELTAQYLLLYELSLPYGLGLDNYLDIKKSSMRVNAVGDIDTKALRELEVRAMSWLKKNASSEIATNPTGMSLIFAHISARNIETMLTATLLAFLLISIILIVALKSIKLGLISLIPNVLPAAVAVGLWGWIYGELGMAIAVVGAMTLGIIVDDTIHFLSRFQKALKNGSPNAVNAIRYAFDSVGGALFTTTCALVAGFGILAFSGFQVNWGMGLLAAMTIAIALLTDFLLLPLVLTLAYRTKSANSDPNL